MIEAIAARYEDELEAETAAGYLRSMDIEVRVRFQASLGLPRSTVPIRVIAPTGGFELLVPDTDLERARDALAFAGPPPPRPQRYRWLGWVLIVVLVAALLINWIASLIRTR
ncbi:MAG: hypothetical protein E6J35_12645 [Chloroflexi bacterium]|nr:MAG: hypothetical protein E6J35_12645 [Chloroflexota bacterium]